MARAPELTDKAIQWLMSEHPGAIIVTEFSVADWGGARVDVAAITDTEIVGVEVKGEGDSPARLELQGLAYGRVVRKMWLLADDSLQDRCFAKCPPRWGRLELWENDVRPYNRSTKLGERIKINHGYRHEIIRDNSQYDPDVAHESRLLCPHSMCGTLWRDELYEIARLTGVEVRGRATVAPLTQAICAQLPSPTIHAWMIDQLRRRSWRKPVIDTRT
ncbi:MAG TPA: hypothetical protein ENK28_04585 [Aliiroseovarius sp.]|nr:hypothetical protein [Aliiroseovarius sp.]